MTRAKGAGRSGRQRLEDRSGAEVSSSTAARSPAGRPVTTLREAGRDTAWCCLGFVALIGLVTEMESREGETLAPSGADRATARQHALGLVTAGVRKRHVRAAFLREIKVCLFQNSNFLILEHWLKFNTDTSINSLGSQSIYIG